MSSISFLDKIEVRNNNNDLRKNIKIHNKSNPDYRVDLTSDPEVSEIITLVPEQKPFLYSDKLQKPIHVNTIQVNLHTKQYIHSKKLDKSDLNFDIVSEHPDGKPCYAEMLGLGHSLKHLAPLFSSIRSLVMHIRQTLTKLSVPNGLTFITDPLNKLMQNISNRFNMVFGSNNPFFSDFPINSKSFYTGLNDQKMERLRSEINKELLDLHDSNPVVENTFNQIRSPWKILNNNIQSRKIFDFGTKLQNSFYMLQHKSELNDDFLKEIRTSLFNVNGINISTDPSPAIVLKKMANLIPDFEARQLISSYAHEGIFTPAFLKLMNTFPKLSKTIFKTPVVSYKISKIDRDTFKLVATNLVKLDPSFATDPVIQEYQSFGMRTSVLFSKNHHPSMKSAFFINRI